MLDRIFKRIFTIRVLRHIIFWLFWLGFVAFIAYSSEKLEIREYFPRAFVVFVYLSIPVYLNLLVFIPKYLERKKYWHYTFNNLFWICIFSFLKIYTKLEIIKDPIDENLGEEISTAVTLGILFIIITSFLHFFREWLNLQDIAYKLKDVEKEKLEAELKLLKGQLNPHFMFNTLNNIYSLSLDKSDETPGLILKLSDLMSYTLYECREEKVYLKDEINFITNYLELEKIRLNGKVDIEFDYNVNGSEIELPPLLFIPFIENAFKHGVNQRPKNPYIKILLNCDEKVKLNFYIENNKNPNYHIEQKNIEGIGIYNIERRLDLLYPEKHELIINEEKDKYSVELTLLLS